jgi:two-component system nitrate/nitrite response regulator NarL
VDLPLRLLVADDNEALRIGVRTLIGEKFGWNVCGEAANGEEVVAMVRDLAPDVIILDLTMPIMNGFRAAEEIRLIAPSAKIVIFSVHDVPVTARQVGADAFVSKSSSARELIDTIERVVGQPRNASSNAISA